MTEKSPNMESWSLIFVEMMAVENATSWCRILSLVHPINYAAELLLLQPAGRSQRPIDLAIHQLRGQMSVIERSLANASVQIS